MVIHCDTTLQELESLTAPTFTAHDLATVLGVADPNVVLDDDWLEAHLLDVDNTTPLFDCWLELTALNVSMEGADPVLTEFAQGYLPTFIRAHTWILQRKTPRGVELGIWTTHLSWFALQPPCARFVREGDETQVLAWYSAEVRYGERTTGTWDEIARCLEGHSSPEPASTYGTFEATGPESDDEPIPGDPALGLRACMRFEMLMSTLHPFLIHAASSPRFSNLIKTHSQTPAHRRLARTLTSIVAAWRSAGFPFEDSMSTEMSSAQEIADVFDGKMTLRRLLALNEERKARCWASCEVKRMDVDPDDYGACQPGKLRSCGRCKVVRFCGVDHQKFVWSTHKSVCFAPKW